MTSKQGFEHEPHGADVSGLDIICLGELLIDFFPGETEDVFLRRPGGAPANVAVTAAKNGFRAGVCSRVGDDAFGRYLGAVLENSGVRFLTPAPVTQATTTMAFVTLDETGNRSFTFARKPGADMFLDRQDVAVCAAAGPRIVHAGSCSLSAGPAADATRYALQAAKESGKIVSFDVNYRDLMWAGDKKRARQAIRQILPLVDLLKFSDEEEDVLRMSCQELSERYRIPVVVETLGPRGARAFFGDRLLSVQPRQVNSVDTTGAGDAFWGTFVSVVLHSGAHSAASLDAALVKTALEFGNVAGSLCVQKKGAMEGLPTLLEIERLLA